MGVVPVEPEAVVALQLLHGGDGPLQRAEHRGPARHAEPRRGHRRPEAAADVGGRGLTGDDGRGAADVDLVGGETEAGRHRLDRAVGVTEPGQELCLVGGARGRRDGLRSGEGAEGQGGGPGPGSGEKRATVHRIPLGGRVIDCHGERGPGRVRAGGRGSRRPSGGDGSRTGGTRQVGPGPGGRSQPAVRGSSRERPREPSHFAEGRAVRSNVSQFTPIRPKVGANEPHS